jgi:hypothetical protein
MQSGRGREGVADRVFVVRPEDKDRDWRVARNAMREVCAMTETGKPVEVRIRFYKRKKSLPQNSTVWMWNTEVSSQLTQRCRESGADVVWSPEDVHDLIFKARMMPMVERMLPDGEVVAAPMGTSDERATVEVMSEAMEKYLAWIYEQGMEVTIPMDPLMQELAERAA